MIKIRLMGTKDEVERARMLLELSGCFTVLEYSKPYANQNSRTVRVYMDVVAHAINHTTSDEFADRTRNPVAKNHPWCDFTPVTSRAAPANSHTLGDCGGGDA